MSTTNYSEHGLADELGTDESVVWARLAPFRELAERKRAERTPVLLVCSTRLGMTLRRFAALAAAVVLVGFVLGYGGGTILLDAWPELGPKAFPVLADVGLIDGAPDCRHR